MEYRDYKNRSYLSAIEAAKYLNISKVIIVVLTGGISLVNYGRY